MRIPEPASAKCIDRSAWLQGSGDSATLLARIAHEQSRPAAAGLYAHIPFCFHKCHYCDFYSIVDDRDRQAAFTDRLIEDLAAVAPLAAGPIQTLFIGGGTPTLLRPDLWVKLLDTLASRLDIAPDAEFTVEANPETLTPALLEVLVRGGVNRMSVGAQSFNPLHLKTLERWHDPDNVDRAIAMARDAGIDNLNLDLIFAIPGQTPGDWKRDLERALSLRPAHLSCYSLMYEPNTPLKKKLEMGLIGRCDEDLEAELFQITIDTLVAAGYEHYEVSNFAQPGRRCRHNLLYWHNENWLAVGPSASGHFDGVRWKNKPHLGQYLASAGGAPAQDIEALDPQASIGEQLMLRLRLLEGVPHGWLEVHLNETRRAAIQQHIGAGLLEQTPTHLRLTPRGLMVADTIFIDLL